MPDEVLRYLLGHFGAPPGEVDDEVAQRAADTPAHPRARPGAARTDPGRVAGGRVDQLGQPADRLRRRDRAAHRASRRSGRRHGRRPDRPRAGIRNVPRSARRAPRPSSSGQSVPCRTGGRWRCDWATNESPAAHRTQRRRRSMSAVVPTDQPLRRASRPSQRRDVGHRRLPDAGQPARRARRRLLPGAVDAVRAMPGMGLRTLVASPMRRPGRRAQIAASLRRAGFPFAIPTTCSRPRGRRQGRARSLRQRAGAGLRRTRA